MKLQTLLCATLLSSTSFGADDQFNPNNLPGNSSSKRQQLCAYLGIPGSSESLCVLTQQALALQEQHRNAVGGHPIAPQPLMAQAPQPQQNPQDQLLQQQIQQHLATIHQQEQTIQRLTVERDTQQAQTTDLAHQKQQLETAIRDIQSQLQAKTTELEALMDQHAANMGQYEVLSRSVETYHPQIQELRNLLEQEKAKHKELESALREEYEKQLATAAQENTELRYQQESDKLLITSLKEQIKRLQEAQKTVAPSLESPSSSTSPSALDRLQQVETEPSSSSSAPSAPPPPPAPSSAKKVGIVPPPVSRFFNDPKSQQEIAQAKANANAKASSSAEKKTGREGLLTAITARAKKPTFTSDQIDLLRKIKLEIENGKRQSVFQPKASTQPTGLAGALAEAIKSRRPNLEQSRDEESDSDWSDSESTSAPKAEQASTSTSSAKTDNPEMKHKLRRIRQIYRDALGIGYEDTEQKKKWHPDRWLLWEDEHYRTPEQKQEVDARIDAYIEANLGSLKAKYEDIDFRTISYKNGVPMAPIGENDSMLISVCQPTNNQ